MDNRRVIVPSVAIPAHNLRGSCGVFRLNLCDVLRNIPKQINAVGGYAKNNFVLFHFFNPFCRRSARLLAFPFRSLASSASDFYRRTEKQKRLSSARSELLPVLASLLVLTRFCAYSVFNVRFGGSPAPSLRGVCGLLTVLYYKRGAPELQFAFYTKLKRRFCAI